MIKNLGCAYVIIGHSENRKNAYVLILLPKNVHNLRIGLKSDWTKNKKAIAASIKKHQKALISISDQIWSNAELALEEHKSSKVLSDYAEKNGFNVERGVAAVSYTHLRAHET